MNTRKFQYSPFVGRLIGAVLIAPSANAQIRFLDRLQTQSQAPSRWDTAISNAQQGRFSLGRRVHNDASQSQAQS
jgi:hypothetical protein